MADSIPIRVGSTAVPTQYPPRSNGKKTPPQTGPEKSPVGYTTPGSRTVSRGGEAAGSDQDLNPSGEEPLSSSSLHQYRPSRKGKKKKRKKKNKGNREILLAPSGGPAPLATIMEEEKPLVLPLAGPSPPSSPLLKTLKTSSVSPSLPLLKIPETSHVSSADPSSSQLAAAPDGKFQPRNEPSSSHILVPPVGSVLFHPVKTLGEPDITVGSLVDPSSPLFRNQQFDASTASPAFLRALLKARRAARLPADRDRRSMVPRFMTETRAAYQDDLYDDAWVSKEETCEGQERDGHAVAGG